MKTEADVVASAPPVSRTSDVLTLMKVRLNTLVVFTTAGGYYMASRGDTDLVQLITTCVGTALVASGAAGVNQVAEGDIDRLMDRTRDRPVAAGRMTRTQGHLISIGLSLTGLGALDLAAGLPATALAVITWLTYVFIYTPLKRRSSLSTVVGAVPGALPPLIGWAAAGGSLAVLQPWTLFLIMFFWQLPHFLAISWLYRDDYARAGLPMLAVLDTNGAMTGRQAAIWAATLVPMARLLPSAIGMTGNVYGAGAIVLGLALVAASVAFAVDRSRANARLLFLGSITYLPLLWILMAFSRS